MATVPYLNAPSEELAKAVLDSSLFPFKPAAGGVTATGICPRCKDSTTVFIPTRPVVVPTAGTLTAAKPGPATLRPDQRWRGHAEPTSRPYYADVRCKCSEEHAEEKVGCGAHARVKVTPKG